MYSRSGQGTWKTFPKYLTNSRSVPLFGPEKSSKIENLVMLSGKELIIDSRNHTVAFAAHRPTTEQVTHIDA